MRKRGEGAACTFAQFHSCPARFPDGGTPLRRLVRPDHRQAEFGQLVVAGLLLRGVRRLATIAIALDRGTWPAERCGSTGRETTSG